MMSGPALASVSSLFSVMENERNISDHVMLSGTCPSAAAVKVRTGEVGHYVSPEFRPSVLTEEKLSSSAFFAFFFIGNLFERVSEVIVGRFK